MTYPPMQPQRPPQKMKRFGFVALAVAGVVGMFAGGMIGVSTATSTPAPTVTVAAPEPEPTAEESTYEPTEEPTEEPEPAAYVPKKSEWTVKVTTRKKQCFGSAGCNVTVKTEPIYVGDRALPDTGTIEVFYTLSGDESGPITESFTVTGGKVHYTEEEDLSTKSSGTKVKSKITDATYDEN